MARRYRTQAEWRRAGRKFGKHPEETELLWEVGEWWCAFDRLPAHEQRKQTRKEIIESADWDGPGYAVCKLAGLVYRKFPPGERQLNLGWSKHEAVKSLPVGVAVRLLKETKRKGWTDRQLRKEVQRTRSPYQEKPLKTDIVVDIAALIQRKDRFNVLYIDPAWPFDDDQNPRGGTAKHYRAIHLDKLRGLPIRKLATDRAFLLLWCPAATLVDAVDVMKAWGFAYKTFAVWDKEVIGGGSYFRMQHECLLLGVLPKSGTFVERPRSVFDGKRGIHSSKPEKVYDMVERAVPGGPFLELFATSGRAGWTACGNMIDDLPEAAD